MAIGCSQARAKTEYKCGMGSVAHTPIIGDHTANVSSLRTLRFFAIGDAVPGRGLLAAAAGPDFRTAMLHPNVTGWEKDEPADEGC